MRISLYGSIGAFVTSLATWQKNPPMVKERREDLAIAVKAYQKGNEAIVEIRREMGVVLVVEAK
jgi:hypothetical protein